MAATHEKARLVKARLVGANLIMSKSTPSLYWLTYKMRHTCRTLEDTRKTVEVIS